MTDWIKDNFGMKNLLILILVILAILLFIKGPSWYKLLAAKGYDGSVKARVANVVAKKSTFQHINGTSTKTVGYDITYVYEVKNVTYSNTEFFEPESDVNLISEQFNAGKPCVIEIKYSLETPSRSSISKLRLSE